jgi:hypothetical protein
MAMKSKTKQIIDKMIRESGLISNGGKRVGWLAQLV